MFDIDTLALCVCVCVCRTFAYVTVKDRMPRILTQVIDTVHKEETNMKTQYGEVSWMIMCNTR